MAVLESNGGKFDSGVMEISSSKGLPVAKVNEIYGDRSDFTDMTPIIDIIKLLQFSPSLAAAFYHRASPTSATIAMSYFSAAQLIWSICLCSATESGNENIRLLQSESTGFDMAGQ